MRVPANNESILEHYQEREGSFYPLKCGDDRLNERLVFISVSEEVEDRLGVRCRAEYRTLLDELSPEVISIDEVTVVRDGGVPKRDVRDERLQVSESVPTSGCVSNVSDRALSWKFSEIKTTENIGD